jgi:MoaA/NifB/PqqE/SkfB family radical SAM enzyme
MDFFFDEQGAVFGWNGGPLSLGCIAAGRSGGYFYIDWDGNITPCVFFPYAIANINRMYEGGQPHSNVLFTDYFARIRNWQDSFRGNEGTTAVHNMFCPCPMREYHRRMREYDTHLQELLDPMSEEEFETGPSQ